MKTSSLDLNADLKASATTRTNFAAKMTIASKMISKSVTGMMIAAIAQMNCLKCAIHGNATLEPISDARLAYVSRNPRCTIG